MGSFFPPFDSIRLFFAFSQPRLEAQVQADQDEIGLIGGQHEDGDVLAGQRRDDRLCDLGDAHRLRAERGGGVREHVERQPHRALRLQLRRGLQLCPHNQKSHHSSLISLTSNQAYYKVQKYHEQGRLFHKQVESKSKVRNSLEGQRGIWVFLFFGATDKN